jgi:hypothetical protein
MVRFSDMLGGNSDGERARAATVPVTAPIDDDAASDEPDEPDDSTSAAQPATSTAPDLAPDAPLESAAEVLDRLTQYATSARSPDAAPSPPGAPPPPVGDDLLPRQKPRRRRG